MLKGRSLPRLAFGAPATSVHCNSLHPQVLLSGSNRCGFCWDLDTFATLLFAGDSFSILGDPS